MTKRSLRHLLYGNKLNAYRVLYEIGEHSHTVRVLTIRDGTMEEVQRDEL